MTSASNKPLTLLVVDHSRTTRRAIRAELAPLHAHILEASTGAEAVSLACKHRPDLITLDIKMPGMSGYDVCEELKLQDDTVGIPIVMMSASQSEQERLQSIVAGAVEYFTKPFQAGALRRFVLDLFAELRKNRDKMIFCIDESRTVRSTLHRFLRNNGYGCRFFSEQHELLQALRTEPCDVLLLDLSMADRAGYEILETIRREPLLNLLSIVGLSDSGSRKDLQIAFRAGVDDFVRKPFFIEEVLARCEAQMRLRSLKQHLRFDTTVDPVTRVFNRRELSRLLRVEVQRSLRARSDLGILLVGIDHFKSLNDGHGHSFGDEVLRRLADCLVSHVRATDIVARFGGDKFVIVAPATSREGTMVLAERLRAELAGQRFASPVDAVGVTASVGVCVWDLESLTVNANLESLLEPASDALYAAKSGGRNRSVAVDAPSLSKSSAASDDLSPPP